MNNDTTRKEGTKAITRADKGLPEKNSWYNRETVFASLVALIIVLVVTVGGYYLWREIQNTNEVLVSRFSEMQKNKNAAYGEIQELKKHYNNLSQQINDLQTKNEILNDTFKQIDRQQSTSNIDIALSEIEYLLIIANHRLILQKDVPTALAAMDSADRRLKGLSDPRIIAVREQLTADINQLRAVNPVDIAGLALYLADLILRVEQLPVRNNIASMQKQTADTAPSINEDGWRHVVSLIWLELKSLVIISRDKEISPVRLLPDEVYFLYQNLRLELVNARLAVLAHDNGNLQASLSNIINWLNHYFNTGEAAVSNILESLQQMQSLQLDPDLPDISSSLESVRAYIRIKDEKTAAPAEDSGPD
jgi:uroporphyrin-3 C-methyltransferase